MLLKNKKLFILASVLLVAGALVFGYLYTERAQDDGYEEELTLCETNNDDRAARINCWIEVLRKALRTEGTERAFELFSFVYQNYEDFSNTGCHLHAHRMGDIAYYDEYLTHQDISLIDFPKNSISCGYGFYHGFIEHMIQDRPEPDFVEEQCEYLIGALQDVGPGISGVCYHAGGHGFMMARADELHDPEEWTIANFTMPPLEKCDQLDVDDHYLKEECWQGVFNVFTNWMEIGEYGIHYNPDAPYEYCHTLENPDYQYACYTEMTRKINYAAHGDPVKALEIIKTVRRPEMHVFLLVIAVAGTVQDDPYGSQEKLLQGCRAIEDSEFKEECFKAIVHGLFEHGIPGAEYKLADAWCAASDLTETEDAWCYERLAEKLGRFRTDAQIGELCQSRELSARVCELVL